MSNNKITIKDIARDCGVGLGTVSRVINDQPGVKDEVRRKVRQYIEDIGWRSHGLRGRFKLGAVGRTVPIIASTSLLERKYDHDPLRVLLEDLSRSGYTPFALFGPVRENLERIADSSPCGVVLFGGRAIHNPAIAVLRDSGIRCVNVGDAEGVEAPTVDSAHELAAARLVRRFRKNGHTHIGFFGGMGMRKKIRSAADVPLPRIQAILKGIRRVDPDFDLASSAVSDSFDDLSTLRKQLKQGQHTAWLCGDEKSCRQFLHCSASLGKLVPEDLSVAALTPDLPFYSFVSDVERMFPDNAALAKEVLARLEDTPTAPATAHLINYRFHAGSTLRSI